MLLPTSHLSYFAIPPTTEILIISWAIIRQYSPRFLVSLEIDGGQVQSHTYKKDGPMMDRQNLKTKLGIKDSGHPEIFQVYSYYYLK